MKELVSTGKFGNSIINSWGKQQKTGEKQTQERVDMDFFAYTCSKFPRFRIFILSFAEKYEIPH